MNLSCSLRPGSPPLHSAALALAAMALCHPVHATLPAVTLGEVDSTWQFENSLDETNGGAALSAIDFIPVYSSVTIDGSNGTALDLATLAPTNWIELPNGVGGNGGSALARTNEWTFAIDLKLPSQPGDATLFQTDQAGDAKVRIVSGPGLFFEYYETGSLEALPDFDSLVPVSTGTVPDFNLSPRQQDDHFAFRFRGRIRIATAGTFSFHHTSDDGSQLRINGDLVVDNDGVHSGATASGTVALSEGTHDLEVTYFENTGDELLTVEYEGPGIARQPIPSAVLTHGDAGAIRLGADLVSDPAAVQLDTWHRVVVTSEVAGPDLEIKVYVDGVQTSIDGTPVTTVKPFDGDWSLPDVVRFFTGDPAETQPLLVNSLSFWGGALTAAQAAALGRPDARGLPDLYISNTGNDGAGSLRSSLAAVRNGGLLSFDLALAGQSIVLGTGGPLEVSGKSVAIEARHLDPPATVSGAGSFRVFNILAGAVGSLRGLDLTAGFSPSGGGAVRNLGTLELLECIIRDSSASNGGGIINESSGTLTVRDSTIANNTAGAGGGFTNAGSATLERCTITGNSAGSAGGVEIINFTTLVNCTVAGNMATDGGGGGLSALGSLSFVNCTVSANSSFDSFGFNGGGGIYLDFGAVLHIENSILTGNTSNVGGENNIGGFGDVSSVGANITSGDAVLEPLGDYGGPTLTMPPGEGSPAGGTGIPTANTPATDQRGFPRVIGTLDIGAVETAISGTAVLYDAWVTDNIPAGQDGLFHGDSDGDGVPNGSEYAFRMNPQLHDPLLVPRAFPVPPAGLDRDLQIVIPYRATAADLIYTLLETSDAVVWNEIWRYAVQTGLETVTGPNLQTTIDTVSETVTITSPTLNPHTTFWKIGVQIAP